MCISRLALNNIQLYKGFRRNIFKQNQFNIVRFGYSFEIRIENRIVKT